jgi:hypothetical protein
VDGGYGYKRTEYGYTISSKYIWIRQLVLQYRLSTSREHVFPEGVTKLFSDDQGRR